MFPRSCGILLHVTCLPGPFGAGDLGPAAYRFVDFLNAGGQRYWQVLPLVPTGFGDSPYASPSTFAGNESLVSPESLADAGLISPDELLSCRVDPGDRVPFDEVARNKRNVISSARLRFAATASPTQADAFRRFCLSNAEWLDDYALFMAVKDAHALKSWVHWPSEVRSRESAALGRVRSALEGSIADRRFGQFLFFNQWRSLKAHAAGSGVQVVGDVPIYVAHDSADVWSNPGLFKLDAHGNPTSVAGVPPDYFSADGQRWGNPIYRWDRMAANGFEWWIDRMRSALGIYDVLRLDHFRGFDAYWDIPAHESTARNGTWVAGPGTALFDALLRGLGRVPIIAEDLGQITQSVRALKDHYQFPGMAVLQFAFDSGPTNSFLPHNYDRNLWAYTGTHDNETVQGWYHDSRSTQSEETVAAARNSCLEYLAIDGEDVADLHWHFVRSLYGSVADVVVTPLQDVLGLGNEARMNEPGSIGGNWSWRLPDESYTTASRRLYDLARIYGRLPAG